MDDLRQALKRARLLSRIPSADLTAEELDPQEQYTAQDAGFRGMDLARPKSLSGIGIESANYRQGSVPTARKMNTLGLESANEPDYIAGEGAKTNQRTQPLRINRLKTVTSQELPVEDAEDEELRDIKNQILMMKKKEEDYKRKKKSYTPVLDYLEGR